MNLNNAPNFRRVPFDQRVILMLIEIWKRIRSSAEQTTEECYVNITILGFRFDKAFKWTSYTTHLPDENKRV